MECNTIVFSPAVIMHIFHCGCTLQIYTGIFTIITIYVKTTNLKKLRLYDLDHGGPTVETCR